MLVVCEIPQFGNTGLEGFQGPLFWSEISTILGFQSWEVKALTQAFLRPLLSCPFSQKQEVLEKGGQSLLLLLLDHITTSRKKNKSIYIPPLQYDYLHFSVVLSDPLEVILLKRIYTISKIKLLWPDSPGGSLFHASSHSEFQIRWQEGDQVHRDRERLTCSSRVQSRRAAKIHSCGPGGTVTSIQLASGLWWPLQDWELLRTLAG